MDCSNYDLDVICLRNGLNTRKICKDCGDNSELLQCVLLRMDILKKNKSIVRKLLKLPKVEQKSEKWYIMRQNLITASDFAQALGQGKFGTQNDIIKKKVRPSDEMSVSLSNPFFKWGNMFESVANEIYSRMHYNVKIHEFGLIQHKTLKYFGASPDGISDTGIMLEIKCPYKRKIESGGEIPKQYYYQIQGQLEVCGLSECDYFECQFNLFDTIDGFYNSIGDNRIKGVIVEYPALDGGTQYRYSPILMGLSQQNVSLDEIKHWVDINTNEEFIDVKFWYLEQYNLKRVTLDKSFVDDKLRELEQVWKKILYYRENPEKFNIEVLRTIDIGDTQKFKKYSNNNKLYFENSNVKIPKTTITGYSFINDPNE